MRMGWCLLMLMLVLTASAAIQQGILGIFAETRLQKMAGMPDLPGEEAEMDMLPPGQGIGLLPMLGGVQRLLHVRLWSPAIAPPDASALLIPPETLRLGQRLELDFYRPNADPIDEFDPATIPDFTCIRYWGSSATVQPGQPEKLAFDQLNEERQRAVCVEFKRCLQDDSLLYKPDWTTAFWPTVKQTGRIGKEATLAGTYRLHTTYAGSVKLEVPAEVNFLPPITLTTPKLTAAIPLTKAITFAWKPVAGVLGYHAMIYGMRGNNTFIIWDASAVTPPLGVDWSDVAPVEVTQMVRQRILLPGDATTCTVPASIFTGCDMVYLLLTGYGKGVAPEQDQLQPRLLTTTTLLVMLGGKDIEDMVNTEIQPLTPKDNEQGKTETR